MKRQTKYVMGEKVASIGQLAQLLRGRQWIYWHDPTMTSARPKHPAWLRCMSLEVLEGAIARCQLYRAIPRDKAVICGYGDCGISGCNHHKAHLPDDCGNETHYCDCVFGPVRCIPITEYESRRGL